MSLDSKDVECEDDLSEEEDEDMYNGICGCLKKFHKFLSRNFYKLGFIIAKSPSYFIMVPIFITLIFVTGLQAMKYERDPEYLFSPSNSDGRDARAVVEKYFPQNFSHSFDQSRITRIIPFARVIIKAKDKDTMLRRHIWDEVMEINSFIYNISIEWQNERYSYEDLCAKWLSECIENDVLKLDKIMTEVEEGERFISYPIMLFPTVLPFHYGGIQINKSEGYVEFLQAITLYYWLKNDDWMQEERSKLFEDKFLEQIQRKEFDYISVTPFISKSLEDELEKNTNHVLVYLPSATIAVAFISILTIFSFDWVRSKVQITIIGISTAGLAIGCSFGLLMYLGVPFIGMNLAAPFILLGIGIDDMFVILSAWNRTRIQDEVPIRLANSYKEAAVSITITSLTNMLSFFLGAITPFPSVYIFCIYTGVAILVTYIFFITFFGGCLAVAGNQERQQKHAITFKQIKSKSEAEYESCCYRLWCTGGINKADPLNALDNRPNFLMTCFRDYFAKMLNNSFMKALIILAFVLYLIGAVYGCLQVKEGLDKRNLALDNSYLTRFYDLEDSLFRKLPYRIQIVIEDNVTYSDPDTKKQLLKLHNTFESLSYVGSKIFTQSWMRGFYRFLSVRPKLRDQVTDEESFIKVLKEQYLTPDTPEYLDVAFNEDESRIIASRFVIQSSEIKDTNGDKDMMLALRKVAEGAPFKVFTYHPLFVFFDQFVLVAPLTIQTISLVAIIMMFVSLIFIPNPFCCLWVIFSIISIEVGVVGYMSLWGVSLDCISMINLIMCIGFSVDFSAHISYSYLTAKADSPAERVRECMYNLGLPVIQSGLTTIAGVIVFVVAPSNIFRTFLKIISLVIIFGIMHALLLLPVMLSLLGPGSCQSGKKKSSLNLAINNNSKKEPNYSESSSLEIIPNLGKSHKDKFCQSSVSTCSETNDSDTESTRAYSQNHPSFEYEESMKPFPKPQETPPQIKGNVNPAFVNSDEGKDTEDIQGSTYL